MFTISNSSAKYGKFTHRPTHVSVFIERKVTMVRILATVLAIFGSYILIDMYAPLLATEGITLLDYKVAWGFFVLCGVGYLVYNVK